jgi:hypothetical protein
MKSKCAYVAALLVILGCGQALGVAQEAEETAAAGISGEGMRGERKCAILRPLLLRKLR